MKLDLFISFISTRHNNLNYPYSIFFIFFVIFSLYSIYFCRIYLLKKTIILVFEYVKIYLLKMAKVCAFCNKSKIYESYSVCNDCLKKYNVDLNSDNLDGCGCDTC